MRAHYYNGICLCTAADLASQAFDLVLKNELGGNPATPRVTRTPSMWLDDKIRLSTAEKNIFQYESQGVCDVV